MNAVIAPLSAINHADCSPGLLIAIATYRYCS